MTNGNQIKERMYGLPEYDAYVSDKKLFRKKIRECRNTEELAVFLSNIANSNNTGFSSFTYKLKCDNNWDIPFEDIALDSKDGSITAYFYLHGSRSYKSTKDFSYSVHLIKYTNWERGFGVMVY